MAYSSVCPLLLEALLATEELSVPEDTVDNAAPASEVAPFAMLGSGEGAAFGLEESIVADAAPGVGFSGVTPGTASVPASAVGAITSVPPSSEEMSLAGFFEPEHPFRIITIPANAKAIFHPCNFMAFLTPSEFFSLLKRNLRKLLILCF
jgi:hypothetical protein